MRVLIVGLTATGISFASDLANAGVSVVATDPDTKLHGLSSKNLAYVPFTKEEMAKFDTADAVIFVFAPMPVGQVSPNGAFDLGPLTTLLTHLQSLCPLTVAHVVICSPVPPGYFAKYLPVAINPEASKRAGYMPLTKRVFDMETILFGSDGMFLRFLSTGLFEWTEAHDKIKFASVATIEVVHIAAHAFQAMKHTFLHQLDALLDVLGINGLDGDREVQHVLQNHALVGKLGYTARSAYGGLVQTQAVACLTELFARYQIPGQMLMDSMDAASNGLLGQTAAMEVYEYNEALKAGENPPKFVLTVLDDAGSVSPDDVPHSSLLRRAALVAAKNVPVAVVFEEPTLTRIKALYGDRFEYRVLTVKEQEEEEEQSSVLKPDADS